MYKFLFIVTLLVNESLFSQTYQKIVLLDEFMNSDIDTSRFEMLQKIERGNFAMDTVFKPIKGEFTVKRFLIEDSLFLESGPNSIKRKVIFIIVLKLDISNTIIDGYYYNLFNSEYAYCALNRITKSNKKYKPSLKLKRLNFNVFEFSKDNFCDEYNSLKILKSHEKLSLN